MPAKTLRNWRRVGRMLETAVEKGCHAGLSALTLLAIILLRDRPDLMTDAVWVRATIVVATSLLMASFATRAARGHRRSLRSPIGTAG